MLSVFQSWQCCQSAGGADDLVVQAAEQGSVFTVTLGTAASGAAVTPGREGAAATPRPNGALRIAESPTASTDSRYQGYEAARRCSGVGHSLPRPKVSGATAGGTPLSARGMNALRNNSAVDADDGAARALTDHRAVAFGEGEEPCNGACTLADDAEPRTATVREFPPTRRRSKQVGGVTSGVMSAATSPARSRAGSSPRGNYSCASSPRRGRGAAHAVGARGRSAPGRQAAAADEIADETETAEKAAEAAAEAAALSARLAELRQERLPRVKRWAVTLAAPDAVRIADLIEEQQSRELKQAAGQAKLANRRRSQSFAVDYRAVLGLRLRAPEEGEGAVVVDVAHRSVAGDHNSQAVAALEAYPSDQMSLKAPTKVGSLGVLRGDVVVSLNGVSEPQQVIAALRLWRGEATVTLQIMKNPAITVNASVEPRSARGSLTKFLRRASRK